MDVLKTVLNVDDHAPARFLRTRILQRAGFGVDEADTAAEAIERAPGASLVLLDVRLPDGDGFTVCEAVKKRSPATPVVMVTSIYRTAQARRDAFAVGADAFLLEPVEPAQLVRTVEDLVARGGRAAVDAAEPWLVTDPAGQILEISEAAVQLLNLSARGARGRNLLAFFAENRPKLMTELLRAAEGIIIDRTTVLRPRDRRPVHVRIDVSALPGIPGDRIRLRWIISPESR
jgi:CheY-like chemotaxis protein